MKTPITFPSLLAIVLVLGACALEDDAAMDDDPSMDDDDLGEAQAGAPGGGVFSVLQCDLSHRKKDDPIVFPNQPGLAHLHDFFGSTTTSAFSTYAEMLSSDTTCPLSNDTSGYWAPTLFDRNGQPVPPTGVNAYYRSPEGVAVNPYPKNLRIIAGGDTFNPEDGGSQPAVSFSCKDSGPFFATPPDCTSVNSNVVAHIHFPDCLKIGAIDSPDHRSHMKYASKCPTGYEKVPGLALHVRYATKNARGSRLSSDPPGATGGRSLHADFWNTWDQPALAFLVNRCLNGGRNCKVMTDASYAAMGGP